jgi:hypothetical protein
MRNDRTPDREAVRRERNRSRTKEEPRRTPVKTDRVIGNMHETTYTDEWGRKFAVLVEEGEDPAYGMIVGPLPLDGLVENGMSHDTMIRLHNELFIRKLLTYEDVRRRPQDVHAALQAALHVDVQTIQGLYAQMGIKK